MILGIVGVIIAVIVGRTLADEKLPVSSSPVLVRAKLSVLNFGP